MQKRSTSSTVAKNQWVCTARRPTRFGSRFNPWRLSVRYTRGVADPDAVVALQVPGDTCWALDTVSLLPGRTHVSNEVCNVYS